MRILLGLILICATIGFGQITGIDTVATDTVVDTSATIIDDTSMVAEPEIAVVDTMAVNTIIEADTAMAADTVVVEEMVDVPVETETETPDSAVIDEVMVEETLLEEEMVDENAPVLASEPFESLPMEMSYGYKGFQWGSTPGVIPRLSAVDSIIYYNENIVKLNARLGLDEVILSYHFADSGFWKVEVDFHLDTQDIDSQVDMFLRIEKGMTEIYGPPEKTNQIFSGPSPSYYKPLDVNFSRAFYRSSWATVPVRIELLLNSAMQNSGFALPVFSGTLSTMKLVYYNPDYMFYQPLSERMEPVPSIFDIY